MECAHRRPGYTLAAVCILCVEVQEQMGYTMFSLCVILWEGGGLLHCGGYRTDADASGRLRRQAYRRRTGVGVVLVMGREVVDE